MFCQHGIEGSSCVAEFGRCAACPYKPNKAATSQKKQKPKPQAKKAQKSRKPTTQKPSAWDNPILKWAGISGFLFFAFAASQHGNDSSQGNLKPKNVNPPIGLNANPTNVLGNYPTNLPDGYSQQLIHLDRLSLKKDSVLPISLVYDLGTVVVEYSGELKDGQPHGYGYLAVYDVSKGLKSRVSFFEGHFVEGKVLGKGSLYPKDSKVSLLEADYWHGSPTDFWPKGPVEVRFWGGISYSGEVKNDESILTGGYCYREYIDTNKKTRELIQIKVACPDQKSLRPN